MDSMITQNRMTSAEVNSDSDLVAIYKYLKTVKPVHVDAGPIVVNE